MTASVLSDAFAHHYWATERLFETCAALSPEQLNVSCPGTYGSVIETLRHIVEGDGLYLSVITTGRPSTGIPEGTSLAELRSTMVAHGAAWTELLARELEGDTDVVERDQGWEIHIPMGTRVAQAIHHGTDHRSQICTALTSLGVTPPEIDVWAFAEATGRERAVAPPARDEAMAWPPTGRPRSGAAANTPTSTASTSTTRPMAPGDR